jgi:hypothetical protein
MFKVVVASLTFCVLALEEEAAASRLDADELRRHLNDLEDCHKTLSRAAVDTVRVVQPEGRLLPNRLRSMPCQVRDVVAAFAGGPPVRWPWCGFVSVGIWPDWSLGSLSGIDPLGTARKLPVRKKKSDFY